MTPRASVGAKTATATKLGATGGFSSGDEPGPVRPPRRNGWIAAAVGIALVAAAGVAAWEFAGSAGPHVGITTATGQGQPFAGTVFMASDDQVTDKQWAERATAFATATAAGPLLLDRAPRADAEGFLAKAVPDETGRKTLDQSIEAGTTDMVAIGFFDDCAEDGDVVSVKTGAVNVVVALTHQIQYVLMPVPHGASAEVTISGLKDGTGGITLGMVTPEGTVHMPRILPGQSISFAAR